MLRIGKYIGENFLKTSINVKFIFDPKKNYKPFNQNFFCEKEKNKKSLQESVLSKKIFKFYLIDI